MTKQLKTSAILLALLTSTSVFAAEHSHPGYTETTLTDSKIVKNSYNESVSYTHLTLPTKA